MSDSTSHDNGETTVNQLSLNSSLSLGSQLKGSINGSVYSFLFTFKTHSERETHLQFGCYDNKEEQAVSLLLKTFIVFFWLLSSSERVFPQCGG